MSEVARVKVLEDVLRERERQDTFWEEQPLYSYDHLIQLASICFALAEACKEDNIKNEKYR